MRCFGKEDIDSRIDYLLLSRGMVKESLKDETSAPHCPMGGGNQSPADRRQLPG